MKGMKGGRQVPPSNKERARLERERQYDIQEEFERAEREREERERAELAELQTRLDHARALRTQAEADNRRRQEEELSRQLVARRDLMSQAYAEADSRSDSLGGSIKNILRKKRNQIKTSQKELINKLKIKDIQENH